MARWLPLKLIPLAVNPNETQLLEDMVLAAVNQALAEAKKISTEEMSRATQGFNLPGM